MAGKFEYYQDKKGKYRFRLKAGNGEIKTNICKLLTVKTQYKIYSVFHRLGRWC